MASRLLAVLTTALFMLACTALVVMLGAYLAEVVLRYAFNAPTRWSSDVVAYALCASVALALPTVTRDNGHVAITSLIERLSPVRQQVAFRALAWVSAAACAVATWLLLSQAQAQWRDGIETVAALAIPKWWLSTLIALGFGGAAGHFLGHALRREAAALGGEREL